MGVLISLFQVILDWAQRLKIIDGNLDNLNDTSDSIIGIIFLIIGIVLIYGLSDKIYI